VTARPLNAGHASWSPNNRWIAFTSFGRGKHEPEGDGDI